MKQRSISAAVAAGLFALAGVASAQTAEVPATQPNTGGQASTQTPAGEPNPTQRPDNSMPNARANVRAEAAAQNRDPANSNTPGSQASTTINHQPNATPQVSERTREEVRQEGLKRTPQFGEKGERPDVPTNPTTRTGTPN